jgi:hypothetical protein
MAVSAVNWSPDGRFLCVGSAAYTSSQRMLQVNAETFEKILSVKDACRLEQDFWRKRDFNLLVINKNNEGQDNPPER